MSVVSAFSSFLYEFGNRQSNSDIASAPLYVANKDGSAIIPTDLAVRSP
jgi:hypothetical protein